MCTLRQCGATQLLKERDAIFEDHGIRWSRLLRLPYWDPTRYAVVDAMHNLFLGELRHHCVEVWGIDVKDKTTKRKTVPHSPEEQRMWLARLVADLRKGTLSSVMKPRKGYLVALAQLNGIRPHSKLTKREYGMALINWVGAIASKPCHIIDADSTNRRRTIRSIR